VFPRSLALFTAALAAVLLGGCAGVPRAAAERPAAAPAAAAAPALPDPEPVLPAMALTPGLLYQSLLAEIALQRTELDVALPMYLELARNTKDPRFARRAAEVAVYAHDSEAAAEAARLWAEADPTSSQAAQMVAGSLIAAGQLKEAEPFVVRFLEREAAGRPEALLKLMRLMARGGDRQEQLAFVERVTAPYLDVAEAHFVRAQAAVTAGDSDKAAAALGQALELRPSWEPAALFKAQVEQQSDVDRALKTLRRFTEANPAAREARMQYGRLLVGEKRYDEARDVFMALMKDFPDSADAVRAVALLSVQTKDMETARTHFERLVQAGGKDADLARFYLGQIAEEQKNTEEALKYYDQVGAGEHFLQAQMRAARLLMQGGRADEARARLRAMGERDPSLKTQAVVAEAQLLREAGQAPEAHALLEQALAATADDPDLLYETALMAERVGKLEVMETHLRRLMQIKPDSAHAYNALGYSLADHGRKLDEAQALIAKALELSPDDPFILDSMGWVLYRRGDLPSALDHLQRAFGLRADPEIAAHLGEVLWVMGRREDAKRTWSESQREHPSNESLTNTIRRFAP